MKAVLFLSWTIWLAPALASVLDRAPLSYRSIPPNTYTPPKNESFTTLLTFIDSRPELSTLSELIRKIEGFQEAFNTANTWQYTFFAPTNDAFNKTGLYFDTFADTAKGKWWLGNLLQHHYVPNSVLKSSSFNATRQRFQTGSYLYVEVTKTSDIIKLNEVATVTEADIPVSNGLVHIIDHILNPSAQIFNLDLQKLPQAFIAGSCSNTALPYC